uniref:Uncharacterized protein LOC107423993 isoform X2 n=1 Tax=Rhizophora mucronata TaxID=61149 RepID=A0A2P2MEB7_RHIMU
MEGQSIQRIDVTIRLTLGCHSSMCLKLRRTDLHMTTVAYYTIYTLIAIQYFLSFDIIS